jgi:hypothetical protein
MADKIISEGPGWAVERIGPEEFVNFPGSYAEWIVERLQSETPGDTA